MSDDVSTFTMTLAGREITFRQTSLGQIIMLQRRNIRALQVARELSDTEARVEASSNTMIEVLNFIDKQIVSEDDRQFVEDKMLEGEITWEELVKCLGGAQDTGPDDEAPKSKAVKKSPKAAPAKAAAPRGRPKR